MLNIKPLLLAIATTALVACGGGGTSSTGAGSGGTGGTGGSTAGTVSAISLTPLTATEHWGKTIQLTTAPTDSAGAALTGQTVTYTSSDINVATVSAAGLVTLVNPGTANITAALGGVTSSASVINAKGFAAGTLAVRAKDNCALDDTKTEVLCWGDGYPIHPNLPLQLEYPSPMKLKLGKVPAGTTIASVSPGFKHSCLLTTTGDVYCWGGAASSAGDFAGMGTNGQTPTNEPALVQRGEIPAGAKVTKLSNGFYSTCVLVDDGNVYCWGSVSNVPRPATLQPLSSTAYTAPTKIGVSVGGIRFVDFAVGQNRSCAISDTGLLFCGRNGSNNSSTVLTPVSNPASELPSNVKLIKIKAEEGYGDFMEMLGDDGWLYSSGTGFGRRFGNGSNVSMFDASKIIRLGQGAIPASEKIIDFSPGGIAGSHCAVTTSGKAYCWSSGFHGSLGDGDLSSHDVLSPQLVVQGQLPAGIKFVFIDCGTYHCSALASDRKVYAWGFSEGAAIGGTVSVAAPTLIRQVGN